MSDTPFDPEPVPESPPPEPTPEPEPEPESVSEEGVLDVTVDIQGAPDEAEVEVPGLGLFKNRQPKSVTETQIKLFNSQPFGQKIGEKDSSVEIKVPADLPESDPEQED